MPGLRGIWKPELYHGRGKMLRRVSESLTARLNVRLLALTGGQERGIFDGTDRHAGLEIVGPIDEIQRLAQTA